MGLFQLGDFTLNSGAKSRWKIECDALTDGDIEALAEMIRDMVPVFSEVRGVPRGGLVLAEALKKHRTMSGPILLVDDVLTTGRSLERHRQQLEERTNIPITGAVVFARGQCQHWVQAIFQMPECFWLKPRTR